MTSQTPPADIHNRPCIHVGKQEPEDFTVAAYDSVQRQEYLQPLWARVVVPVEELSVEPSARYSVRITDIEAYNEQMRRLIGIDG